MIVIKLGGNALAQSTDRQWLDLIAAHRQKGLEIVLVHGGGPQIDSEMVLHGIEKRFIEGYRYTDDETFKIVEMVLSSIAQQLVRELRSRGTTALSLSGSDGSLFEPSIRKSPSGQDLGQVGEVERVNKEIIELVLQHGILPVISSMSCTKDGIGININADLAAGSLAGAFAAEKVIFMTDVKGIYRHYPQESSLIAKCTSGDLRELIPTLSEGMIPKVTAIIAALEKGAQSAQVIDGRSVDDLALALEGRPIGTLVNHG